MTRRRLYYEHQTGACPDAATCPGHRHPATADTLIALDHLRTAGRLAYLGPAADISLTAAVAGEIARWWRHLTNRTH